MSSSIDSYYRYLSSLAATRRTETTASEETQKEETAVSPAKQSGDKLEFSQSLTRLLSGAEEVEETPTETYTPFGRPPMSLEDMKSFLSSVEEELGLTAETEGSDLLTDISSQLEGYDAETATDEETARVFDGVMQSLQSLMPPPPPPPPEADGETSEESGTNSLPPLMQAMGGGRMAPFILQSEEAGSEDTEAALDLSSLSTDEQSELLSKLQDLLKNWSSSSSGEDTSALLSSLMDEITAASR
ncbi:hypothetical protein D3C75_569600 [compost metagenome]